jgi:hypothetical protein
LRAFNTHKREIINGISLFVYQLQNLYVFISISLAAGPVRDMRAGSIQSECVLSPSEGASA